MKINWQSPDSFEISQYPDVSTDIHYDLNLSSPFRSEAVVKAFHNADPGAIHFSPKNQYVALCVDGEKDDQGNTYVYHGLELYRVKNDQLISKISGIEIFCFESIRWASDESALSFAVSKMVDKNKHFTDIYVWRTNGTSPYVVGQGVFSEEPGNWSPDSSRLVVEIANPRPIVPEDEETYQIMYPDGRPPTKTKAQLGVRHEPGIEWLTNKIVFESNECCGTVLFFDYYVAETGEHLTDLSWTRIGYSSTVKNQYPLLSNDQRWLILDQTNQSFLEITPFNFIYSLNDLITDQQYIISQSDDILLDFVGWTDDSNFYFIRRPANAQVEAKPGQPFGLLSLDPLTCEFRLIDPNIRFAWLSPDKTHILGVSRLEDRLSAMVYTLDGKALTPPLEMARPDAIPMKSAPKVDDLWNLPQSNGPVWLSWSHDSQRAAVRDFRGNVWLIGVGGKQTLLAENIQDPDDYVSIPESSSNWLGAFWSPQDDYLIIRSGAHAWVVDGGIADKD
jgi:hypothetical protein